MSRSVDVHVQAVAEAVRRAADRRSRDAPVLRVVGPDLRGRLAAPALSSSDIPGFDNSQMDGFAVHSADLAAVPVSLPTVAHVVAGGRPPAPLAPGTVAPIMTGAPIPPGADAVVPVERTRPGDFGPVDGGGTVEFTEPIEPATFVRLRGADIRAGEPLLDTGAPLHAAAVGALVAAGVETVSVAPPLRVAIVAPEPRSPAGTCRTRTRARCWPTPMSSASPRRHTSCRTSRPSWPACWPSWPATTTWSSRPAE